MAFLELLNGHELIAKHTNSVKELPSKGLKEFSPTNSWLEKKRIENQLDEKFNFIKAERIEKSNSVSQAEWVPHLKKARVTKKVGKSWEILGHHLDNEDWLYPEEALFLVENCELQLFYNGICISVEDCYTLLFHEEDGSFDEYRVFSYLSRAGLMVVRHSPSVSATHYERRVKLDAIMQKQKRSPPHISKEKITIIDDDISIVEEPGDKEKDSVNDETDVRESSAPESVIIIEIDDDAEEEKETDKIEIKEIDSDSDSDIVCISSPSYVSDRSSRTWFPPIQKTLRIDMEHLIDLSEDNDVVDKGLLQSKMDLVQVPKADILSRVPSAKNGVSFIRVPDSRLLPPNVYPRYSEYKISLNIKADNSYRNWYNRSNTFINGSIQFNSMDVGIGVGNNPLVLKAQQMQMMAMSMIQTAASLMSVAQSSNQNPHEPWNMNYGNNIQAIAQVNPNELWNMYPNRNVDVPRHSFNSNIPVLNHIRPRFWHPRRNYPRRRRMPYDRRYPWTPRRNYSPNYDNFQANSTEERSSTELCSFANSEVVVLSDDETEETLVTETESEFSNKRKINGEAESSKRVKTEPDIDSVSLIASENSCTLEDTPSTNTSVKKEVGEEIVKNELEPKIEIESIPKVKTETSLSNELLNNIERTEIDTTKQNGVLEEIKSESTPDSSGKENSLPEPTEKQPKVFNCTLSSVKSERPASSPKDCGETIHREPLPSTSGTNLGIELSQEASEISEGSLRKETSSVLIGINSAQENISSSNEEISSWQQYKNTADEFEDVDSLIKFDQCQNYGHVLSALQIFKPIEVNQVTKKFKISFDVYLPESNFKKSLKILPNYRVIILKSFEELPTSFDIDCLKVEYQDNIPFLFSLVFNETIEFFMYNTVSLNTLYE